MERVPCNVVSVLITILYYQFASEVLEARRLVELRGRWLNPPEWVEWVNEPVPGYPRRPVPRDEAAATALKTRTLTNLYNARPQWLADAHATLDAAVATAYGWPDRHLRRRRARRTAGAQLGKCPLKNEHAHMWRSGRHPEPVIQRCRYGVGGYAQQRVNTEQLD